MKIRTTLNRRYLSQAHGCIGGAPAMGGELIARFTGKPRPGQRPLLRLSAKQWWLVSFVTLLSLAGINICLIEFAQSLGAIGLSLVPAIVLLMILTTGRLRVQQVVFGHHFVHRTVFNKSWANKLGANIATAISLSQNPDEYRTDHSGLHHRNETFTTERDPDAAFLKSLGFYEGISKKAARRRLLITICSPRFHYKFALARLSSSIVTSSSMHFFLVVAWLAILIALKGTTSWSAWILAIAIPLGPFYHISALLQFITEHRWLTTKKGPSNDKQAYADRCTARFVGESFPSSKLRGMEAILVWTGWVIRAYCIHIPTRFGVLVGDLPVHDHHHLVGLLKHYPNSWHDAIFERQRAIDEGDIFRLSERELWGLAAALDWVFDGLERAER